MDFDQKFKLFVMQHNTARKFSYGELKPFFDDGFASMSNGTYLAACLCFITGIEMSLRLPLLVEKGKNITDAWDRKLVPLMNHELLRRAKGIGLPVELLAFSYELEDEFLTKIKSTDPTKQQVRITQLRNNICHGNLNIFVTDIEGKLGIPHVDIAKEAKELELIVRRWANGFAQCLNS